MNYKRFFILGLLLWIGYTAHAQVSKRTNFRIQNYKTGIQEIELTFNTFILGIDVEGQISFIEPIKRSKLNYWDDFEDDPLDGRANLRGLNVTYYDDFNASKSGKIKSIDGVPFDYYTEYDIHDRKGILKSVGAMAIKYNNAFDIHDIKGTIKSIGSINIKYNNAFDPNELKGTLKSVGPVKVNWYNSFDAENLRGRIKSVRGNTPVLHVTRIATRADY